MTNPGSNNARLSWAVLFCALLSATCAAADAPTRLAILSGDGDRAVSEATVAQLEAALTGIKDITLLERAEIRKILAEQKLSASGLSDPATAVKMGKLLSVEMFLNLDRIPKSSPAACRVQAVEAQTGFALAAEMVPESALGQKVSAVTDLLTAALAKKRVAPAERHYVGLLELRSEEPGRSLDGLAQAAGMFLMADLGRAPNVIVLDRERVERLTAEKVIAGLGVQVKTSSVLITGGLRRAAEKDKLNFTLELRPLGASSGRKITATAPQNDVPELRRALASAVLEGLGSKPLDLGKTDPQTEAQAFAAQAQMLVMRGNYASAVRAGEAAHALHPDLDTCFAAYDAWCNVGRGQGTFEKLDQDGKKRALEAAIRRQSLGLEYVRLDKEQFESGESDNPSQRNLVALEQREDHLTLPVMTGDLAPLQEELRAIEREAREFKLAYYRSHYDISEFQVLYCWVWIHESRRIRPEVPEADDESIKIIRDVAEAFVAPPGQTLPQLQATRMSCLSSFPHGMQVFGPKRPREKDEKGRVAYASLWHELQQHPDPFVRMVGCEGLLWMGADETKAAHQLLRTFINDLPPDHPYRVELTGDAALRPMITKAVERLASKEPDLLPEYCLAIVEPWVAARDGARLAVWRGVMWYLLSRLEHLGRYAEADKLAEQAIEALVTNTHNSRQIESDSMANTLRTQRQQYAIKLKSSAGPAPEDLWAKYDVKLLFTGPNRVIRRSLVDGNLLYCVSAYSKGDECTVSFDSWKLPSGEQHQPPQTISVPSRPVRGPEQQIAGIACSNACVYAGARFGLLEYIPGGKIKLITEAEGLPATEISALALYGGKLYMGLGTSFNGKYGFASYDPANGKATLIASSVATEKLTPFDGVNCRINVVLADPKRKCLWLTIAHSSELNGLWRYWPETGKFDLAVKWSLTFPLEAVWCGENILLYQPWRGLVLVNPDTLTQQWIMSEQGSKPTDPPPGVTGMPLITDIGLQLWPAWYDGEYLLGGYGTCWARTPGKTASSSKTIFSVVGFHPTPNGLLVTTQRGQAYWIKKKAEAVAEPAEKKQE